MPIVAIVLIVLCVALALVIRQVRRVKSLFKATRFEALLWHERLACQTSNLYPPVDNAAASRALESAILLRESVDTILSRADRLADFQQVIELSKEGLFYIRAARQAMDMELGPQIGLTKWQKLAGSVIRPLNMEIDGQRFWASPSPSARTHYYFAGGKIGVYLVPRGWYSKRWWRQLAGEGSEFKIAKSCHAQLVGYGYDSGAIEVDECDVLK